MEVNAFLRRENTPNHVERQESPPFNLSYDMTKARQRAFVNGHVKFASCNTVW
jgi:hypothetical protein